MYRQEMRWNLPGRTRRILAFSDLHFCDKVVGRRAELILTTLERICQEEKIDYIFFLGDLINSLDVLSDTMLRMELKLFLDELAAVAPVIMVTGNHDVSYYTAGATKGRMVPEQWYRWARVLMQNERIHVLDVRFGKSHAVFDDGVMRVLGMSLPEMCYPTTVSNGRGSAEAFREYAEKVLPELIKVPGREYYLLLHNPQFLAHVKLDKRVAVLAGHMHNGLVPPVVDELMRFTSRGVVAPGYYNRKGRKMSYVPFGVGARYRPNEKRPWLTLNSCIHMPPESWLWKLDGFFPALSYAIISGDESKLKFSSKYFRC